MNYLNKNVKKYKWTTKNHPKFKKSKKKTRTKGVGGGELERNQDHSENGREFFKGELSLEIQDVASKK